MTTEELRELDAEIHRKVMGKEVRVQTCQGATFYWTNEVGLMGLLRVPAYSTDIAAAWLVVEKLLEQEYVKVNCSASHYHGDCCRVTAPDASQMVASDLVKRDASDWGETMPLAICKAALKAVTA